MTKQILMIVVAVLILFLTLFIPSEVHSSSEMKTVALGYPFPFFIQDFSRYTPLTFPQKFGFGSPWEDPAKILWLNVLLSFSSIMIVLNCLYHLVFGRKKIKSES